MRIAGLKVRKLHFRSRSPITEDAIWDVIDTNQYLTVEDVNVKDGNVQVMLYGPVEPDDPSITDFAIFMKKKLGLKLGKVASQASASLVRKMVRAAVEELDE